MPDESLFSTLAALSGVVSWLGLSTESWKSRSPGRAFFDFAKQTSRLLGVPK